RARLAGALSAALLAVALLDLLAVLAWSALLAQSSRLDSQIGAYGRRQAQANALAARSAPEARSLAELRTRLAVLEALPPGVQGSQALLERLAELLPAGGSLSSATLGSGGRLLLTGQLPSYAAVESYVRALQATGRFAYVRVVSEVAGQGGAPAATGAPQPAGVQFQLESWLAGEGKP
ncbi:MAG: fimbrial assembly protein, partial [Clostridia bacterium]|nr:fimbrial assembly protein [Clostridia bacterium]